VRLIDDEGNQIGVLKTPDALVFAQERDLDLVEVAPEARPPVCRVLDYSKYKYEQAQKLKQRASISSRSPFARSSSAPRSPSMTTTPRSTMWSASCANKDK